MGADVSGSVSGEILHTARDHESTRTNTTVFKTPRATAPGPKSHVLNSYRVNQAIRGKPTPHNPAQESPELHTNGGCDSDSPTKPQDRAPLDSGLVTPASQLHKSQIIADEKKNSGTTCPLGWIYLPELLACAGKHYSWTGHPEEDEWCPVEEGSDCS